MAGLAVSPNTSASWTSLQTGASNVASSTGKAMVNVASTVRSQFATLDSFAPERVVAGGAAVATTLIKRGGSAGAVTSSASKFASGASAAGGLFRTLGFSALFAVPVSLVTDYIAFKQGKITQQQRNTLMAADSIGYTVSGAAGSMIGAAAGTALFGPLGTIVGIGAGLGLGFVYEKFIRPMFMGKGNAPIVVTPPTVQSVPSTPPAPPRNTPPIILEPT